MIVDSHCHLTDDRFTQDRADVLARARRAGVEAIVTVASDRQDTERVAALVRQHPELWGTAGIHPHEAGAARADDLERVRELAASEPRLVAVGESGLDYHYDHSPRDVQRRWFERHAGLAAELALPLVVHSRDADEDTEAFVREHGARVAGVLHSFTGGMGLLYAALESGWYVSFSGIVSFRRYDGGDAVRAVPRDRLLVETDAPYLAPVPERGKRNEPAFVVHVAEAVARHRGEDAADVATYSAANARRLFALHP